jgi:hypothetical protein
MTIENTNLYQKSLAHSNGVSEGKVKIRIWILSVGDNKRQDTSR